MDSRIVVRGRVQSGPVELDSSGDPVAAFVVENEQPAETPRHRRATQSVPWCDVVCIGALASNVLDSLAEGDHVVIEGELRVHRVYPPDDGRDSVVLGIRAETVGLDLCHGVAKFLPLHGLNE